MENSFQTAQEIVSALNNNQTTAAEITAHYAAVIAEREPALQAWAYFDKDQAFAQARAIDEREHDVNLPLRGVPVGLKDVIDTRDMPTENGTEIDQGRRPKRDALVVERLRTAGAVIMGKTVTTELAFMKPSRTRNPHNLAYTPGGSSAGSAAAVAAGMVPVALGTQTNGSVIRPASFCGIFALKPTNGLIPSSGVLEEAETLDTVGIFGRSLNDLALTASVLANNKEWDGRSAEAPRIAFLKTSVWTQAEQVTQQAFEMICHSLGVYCEEVSTPAAFEDAITVHRNIMLYEMAKNYDVYEQKAADKLDYQLRKALAEGRTISYGTYQEALELRETLYIQFETDFEGFDAVLTPSATGPAPKGFETTGNPIFCTLWTLLGTPSLNLPLLNLNGMPVGVQLVARRNSENPLFSTAGWLCDRYSNNIAPVV